MQTSVFFLDGWSQGTSLELGLISQLITIIYVFKFLSAIKLIHVDIYTRRLKERERRKKISREFGLITAALTSTANKAKEQKDQKGTQGEHTHALRDCLILIHIFGLLLLLSFVCWYCCCCCCFFLGGGVGGRGEQLFDKVKKWRITCPKGDTFEWNEMWKQMETLNFHCMNICWRRHIPLVKRITT